jgi:transmembrane sensor
MKLNTEHPATAAEWLAEMAERPLTQASKAALADWLRESPRNVRELLDLTLMSEDLGKVRLPPEQIEAWVRAAREAAPVEISRGACSSPSTKLRQTQFGRRRLALAASILLAVVAMAGYLWWQDGRYSTGRGEQKIITLADGSVVTLNTSSELKVRLSAGRRALLLMSGEAFFRVARDANRPFEVTAHETTVRAIGTQFNVRLAPTATIVSVTEGTVELHNQPASAGEPSGALRTPAVRVSRGEEARIARGPPDAHEQPIALVKPEPPAVARAVAWTNGRVEFDDAPLPEVLSEFQRYRELRFEIDPALHDLRLTGSFDARDPESALDYVATLTGIVVEKPAPATFIIRKKELP